MSNHSNFRLREIPGGAPDALEQLKEAVEELFDSAVLGAGHYVKGKGGQESAKATAIRAKALAHLGSLQLEREQLILERDRAIHEHKRSMYELKTIRFKEIVDCCTRLKEAGVTVNLEILIAQMIETLEE